MFETVAPEAFRPASRRVMYETLPFSIAVHALAVGAALVGTVWNVAFPTASPRVSVAYNLAAIPEAPPPPPLIQAPKPQPVKPSPPPPPLAPERVVAPTVIPDTIPQLEPPPPDVPLPVLTDTAPAGPSAGSPDGILGGDIAGKLHGIPGAIAFPEDGRVHIERNQKLPMETVEQEYPKYPAEAQKKRLEDTVIIRYIIGTNGRVKDVQILDHAKDKMFDDATVEAISRWRFRPLIRDGKAVEVVHELAVNFELIVH